MGLFGLGASGDAGASDFGAAGTQLGAAGTYGSQLAGLGGAGNSAFLGNFAPWLASQQNIANYYQNLANNGLNAKQQAAYLGQFGDYVNPYTQAANQSAASAAQRGFGALSGGGNSVAGSADDYLRGQQAANLQSRLSQMGQYQLQNTPMWLQQAAQALYAPVQFGSNLAMQGLGQAGNFALQAAQQFGNLGQMRWQDAMQQNQLTGQGIGSILGLGAQMYGMGKYGNLLQGMMQGGANSFGLGGGGMPAAAAAVAPVVAPPAPAPAPVNSGWGGPTGLSIPGVPG